MAYEIKENTGSLFRNDTKEGETHPDYKGSVKIDGKEYYLSAWVKATKEGKKYFSLSFKEKQAKVIPPMPGMERVTPNQDGLPF